jgi:hypothetical protein
MNYRSVVIIGIARTVREPDDKRRAMEAMLEHLAPGRVAETRPPTDAELRQITVIEVPIDTASVKTRTGGPLDEREDLELEIWAGVVPVATEFGEPVSEADLKDGLEPPPSVSPYARPVTGTAP